MVQRAAPGRSARNLGLATLALAFALALPAAVAADGAPPPRNKPRPPAAVVSAAEAEAILARGETAAVGHSRPRPKPDRGPAGTAQPAGRGQAEDQDKATVSAEAPPAGLPKIAPPAEAGPIESAAVPAGGHDIPAALAPPRAKPTGVSPSRHLSREDFSRLRRALGEAKAGRLDRAGEIVAGFDADIRTLVEWVALRSAPSGAGHRRTVAFLRAHPLWPEPSRLRAGAEADLFSSRAGPDPVLAYFAEFPPVSGLGKLTLANAHLERKEDGKARDWYARAWREDTLGESIEKLALKRCAECVSEELDKERLDRMAYREEHQAAKRAAKRLGKAHERLATARHDVSRRARVADRRYQAVPDALKNDLGLSLSRVTWLRRQDRDAEARKILLAVPGDPAKLLDPSAWWTERRLIARGAVAQKAAAEAYRIVSAHGLTEGEDFAEAEFLAGWIALRHLGDPAGARAHFTRLRAAVETPISVARSEYWLARAAAALGERAGERAHLKAAAGHGTAYYGQLARQALEGGQATLRLPADPFDGQPAHDAAIAGLIKGAEILAAAGERWLAAILATEAGRTTKDGPTLVRLATFVNVLAYPQVSIRIAKAGVAAGAPVYAGAYPTVDYPTLADAPAVEPALLYALTRQESEFNWQASSHAGARGLMQIMPATGRALAKQANVEFSLKRLGEDPDYNAALGARYLAEMIAAFGGSYVLAVAAYNAGPGRVGEWIDAFGDPRDPSVDPIDWVETIPFNDTRNYVQRVLENLQVYRARLADGTAPLRLVQDIDRGRTAAAQARN